MDSDTPCDLPEARHPVETNPDEDIAYLLGHGVAMLKRDGELRLIGILIRNPAGADFTVVGEHELWRWFNEPSTLAHTREVCNLAHHRSSFGNNLS
jgi:hypothetical protein